jgi:flavin reductase (DIM6/NTAB) family NADH-FMN oxidoreductase RutF
MTIHTEHPFADPPDDVRRLRGRLGGAVSLWTSGSDAERAGLTVSSLLVGHGDPATVIGLLDPDAALLARLVATGTAVVHLLDWADRDLAEAFGGTAPAPGGPFRLRDWTPTTYGPALPDRTRAAVRLLRTEEVGWSVLVVTAIEELAILPDQAPLAHRRGRYRRAGGDPD